MKSLWKTVIVAGALFVSQIMLMGMPQPVSAMLLTCGTGGISCFGLMTPPPKGSLGHIDPDLFFGSTGWARTNIGWSGEATESHLLTTIDPTTGILSTASVTALELLTMYNFAPTQIGEITYMANQTWDDGSLTSLDITFQYAPAYRAQVGDFFTIVDGTSLSELLNQAAANHASVTMGLQYGGVTFEMVRSQPGLYAVGAVPEPATMLLFGTGLAGLVGSWFRRRKQE